MDITLDIGKNIIEKVTKIANEEKKELDVLLLELVDLGLRLYLSSKESKDDIVSDPILSIILKNVACNTFLLREVLGHVFNKDNSYYKVYDTNTAINITKNMADSFMESIQSL